jgi:hypothetical protein
MPKASAIAYYRMKAPLAAIQEMEIGNTYVTEPGDNAEKMMDAMMASDIAIEWRPYNKQAYALFKDICEFEPQPKDNRVVYPPLIIMDSDDATDWVHPFNNAYSTLGIRNQKGEILKPGDNVTINVDGFESILWEDKKTVGQAGTTFDIERNLQDVGYHYDCARLAAGVTVTNDFLANIYKDEDCEEIYVYPNSLNPADYWFPPLAPHEEVRIIWEGGDSHMDSWISIREPLIDVLKNNPQAKLVVFGPAFDWMRNQIKPEQFEHHNWVQYDAYKLHRYCMAADINLAPLVDSAFTRSKSAIRWYEASMGPNPEATLAANVGPYQEIENGKTGIFYNTPQEFAQNLHELINNEDLRKRLGPEAQKWVLANRTVEKTVPGLVEFYKHLLAKQRREFLAK